ncbi:MAG: sugar ABC transporter ATP-binding protein [Balneolales bacterium]
MTSDIILSMSHIRKEFPGVVALDDVSFRLQKGEVHILLGENGAGKSTLMKILSGAYGKDRGNIFLDGEETQILNPRHAQKLGIGIIYQEFNLNPHMTVAENIFLGREPVNRLGIIDEKKLNRTAREIIQDLGVNIDAGKKISEIGIARQQMVEVAKALSLNARILIMDEPSAPLTRNEITRLFEMIRRLAKRGVSIVYISHRMSEIYEIGDRVTVLRDGKNVGTRNIAEIDRRDLIRLMVNRDLDERYPSRTAEVGEEILRVEGLERKGVLTNINFRLHRGEILGIAGLMGSGRTELARAIYGVDPVSAGKIYVRNKLANINSPRKAIRLGMGFLTEDRKSEGLVLVLSVKENITVPSLHKYLKFGVLNFKRELETVNGYIESLSIKTPGANQMVINLSGGNQQKVVLSKWLCCQSDIFIFDEPTRGIDVGAKAEIYSLMNLLTSRGVAIIMISSELPEILGMSDRMLVMHKGSIAGELTREQANQEKIMEYAIGEHRNYN